MSCLRLTETVGIVHPLSDENPLSFIRMPSCLHLSASYNEGIFDSTYFFSFLQWKIYGKTSTGFNCLVLQIKICWSLGLKWLILEKHNFCFIYFFNLFNGLAYSPLKLVKLCPILKWNKMSLVLTTLAFSLGFISFWKCQVALAYSRFLVVRRWVF